MKRPEDEAWQEILRRLNLDLSDRDLREAERRLAGIEPEPLDASLEEKVLDRVFGSARRGALLAWRRVAAAAVATVGGSKLAAAALVAGGIAAASLIWVGHHSSRTMTYPQAVAILSSPDSARDAAASALGQVAMRLRYLIGVLREVAQDPLSPAALSEAAAKGLLELRLRAEDRGEPLRFAVEGAPGLVLVGGRMTDRSLDEAERLHYVHVAVALADRGLSAILEMPLGMSTLAAERAVLLDRLRRELAR
ncbi:MAG: hypothetical protein Fur0037_16890 [Planctomycetota bacterium]